MTRIIFDIALVVILLIGTVYSKLPDGLLQQKNIRDCNVIYGYEYDDGCFMEHLSTGEMIRPCASTLYDPLTCGCTKTKPPNYQPNSECNKAIQHGGYILHQTSGQSIDSGNTQNHQPHHSSSTNQCDSNPSFTKLLQLQHNGIHCTTLDEVIEDLYQTTLTDNQMTCVTELMRAMKNQTAHPNDACACETSHRLFSWPALDSTASHCLQYHGNYQKLMNHYYYSHHHHHSTRTCFPLYKALPLLDGMKDHNCVRSFIQLLRGTMHNNDHNNYCHCTVQTSETCRQIQEYNDVINAVKSDHCLGSNQVWIVLEKLEMKNKPCGEIAIRELSHTYGRYNSTTASCKCSEKQSSFQMVSLSYGLYQTCKYNQHYREIHDEAFGGPHHHRICQTHHKLWTTLVKIKETDGQSDCVNDLIRHMKASVMQYGDPCSCGQIVQQTSTPSTTITVPSTTTETKTTATYTTAPIIEYSCDKLQTITALAHSDHIALASTQTCNDGAHTLPEAAVKTLCQTPDSSLWKQGKNVLQNCNSIPRYTAIASFTNGLYFQEGISGVFMGCNATTLSIATQFCAIPMDIIHLDVRAAHSHYYDMPQFYFTIGA